MKKLIVLTVFMLTIFFIFFKVAYANTTIVNISIGECINDTVSNVSYCVLNLETLFFNITSSVNGTEFNITERNVSIYIQPVQPEIIFQNVTVNVTEYINKTTYLNKTLNKTYDWILYNVSCGIEETTINNTERNISIALQPVDNATCNRKFSEVISVKVKYNYFNNTLTLSREDEDDFETTISESVPTGTFTMSLNCETEFEKKILKTYDLEICKEFVNNVGNDTQKVIELAMRETIACRDRFTSIMVQKMDLERINSEIESNVKDEFTEKILNLTTNATKAEAERDMAMEIAITAEKKLSSNERTIAFAVFMVIVALATAKWKGWW